MTKEFDMTKSDLFKDFANLQGTARALMELNWENATAVQRVTTRAAVVSLLEASTAIEALLRLRQEHLRTIEELTTKIKDATQRGAVMVNDLPPGNYTQSDNPIFEAAGKLNLDQP